MIPDVLSYIYQVVNDFVDENGSIPKEQVPHLISHLAHSYNACTHRVLNNYGVQNLHQLNLLSEYIKIEFGITDRYELYDHMKKVVREHEEKR